MLSLWLLDWTVAWDIIETEGRSGATRKVAQKGVFGIAPQLQKWWFSWKSKKIQNANIGIDMRPSGKNIM